MVKTYTYLISAINLRNMLCHYGINAKKNAISINIRSTIQCSFTEDYFA
ncbi:protein of unknown function [Xenorhabdus nematophila AN6/1]|nr:protein of unknown function [Xenorhabdus nematophila AN6/1]